MGLIKTDGIAPNGSTGLLLYTDIQATVVGLKLESGGGVGFGSAGVPSGIKVDVLGNIATASLSIPNSSTIPTINTISTMRIGQTNSSTKLNIGCNNSSSWIQSYNISNSAGAPLLLQSGGGNVGIGTASPTVALDVSGTVNATSLNVVDADRSNSVGFKAPTTVASNVTWTLPGIIGSSGQFLRLYNNVGGLTWETLSYVVTAVPTETQVANAPEGSIWFLVG